MIYALVRLLSQVYFGLRYGMSSSGNENVPAEGPVILVSNHVNAKDPFVLAAVCRRPLYFMGKAELFRVPAVAWLFRAMNAFPVERGAIDRGAYRRSMEILSEGKVLAIFPEGTRNASGELLKPHPGAARFSLLTGAKVVPASLVGTASTRGRIRVAFGAPMDPRTFCPGSKPTKEITESFADAIMAEVESLMRVAGAN